MYLTFQFPYLCTSFHNIIMKMRFETGSFFFFLKGDVDVDAGVQCFCVLFFKLGQLPNLKKLVSSITLGKK